VSGSQVESVLRRIREALDSAGVPYMLTGSFASSLHGAPRVTHDVDVVIAPVLGSLLKLFQQFPVEQYYVDRDVALQAYATGGMFNVVDYSTGWKIDFIFRKPRPFSVEEFERRREQVLDGVSVFVASPEDVILAKLEWAKLGESERQLRDAAGILSSHESDLDLAYIEKWATSLEVTKYWERVKQLRG
jgi:hypothetical protein